jgi:hypothetical protein
MTRPIHLELFTDFFNKIGQERRLWATVSTSAFRPMSTGLADVGRRSATLPNR